MEQDYHQQLKMKNILLLREKLKGLPMFLKDFFRGIEDQTSSRTRIGYAHDLSLFFNFLTSEVTKFCGIKVPLFSIEDLARVTSDDIEDFMEYLSYYVKNSGDSSVEVLNEEYGKARKLSAVRSMFGYFFKKRMLDANPAELVDAPKLHEKAKVYLDVEEVARLLDEVESGDHLTERQKAYHKLTASRDLAILTLLLGTGIRISELVGINIEHINFENGSFLVTRKGGNQVILYFGDEVEAALTAYLDRREKILACAGHENALFLSMQNKRLTDRAIQNLVRKYTQLITSMKKITPHKLRTTFGTNLYRETGDIYLVADILGHKDVNTTRKHYADTSQDNARKALKSITLRE